MRIITIAEASGIPGEIVPCIKGTLISLFAQKTGISAAGDPWSLQNGEVQDSTGKMRVTFSSREPLPDSLKGEEIILESKTTKFGLQGVKVKENNFKGKTTIELHITPSAIITFPNATAPTNTDIPEQKQSQPMTKAPEKPMTQIDGIEKARKRIMQFSNLYSMTLKAARYVGETEGLEGEDIRQISTTFFIQSVKEGLENGLPNNGPIPEKSTQAVKKEDLENDDIPY